MAPMDAGRIGVVNSTRTGYESDVDAAVYQTVLFQTKVYPFWNADSNPR
jgi:hypothetical protein